MSKVGSILFALAILAAASSAAETGARVNGLEGEAFVESPEGWHLLNIGDSLACDACIKVGDHGSVSLELDSSRITLTAPGLYSLSRIQAEAASMRHSGFFEASSKLFAAIGKNRQSSESVAMMGVRGADSGYSDLQWSESDAPPPSGASDNLVFENAYNCYANGDAAGALALLAHYDAGQDRRKYAEAIELSALLKIATFDASGALDTIEFALPVIVDGASLRSLYYLGFVAATVLHDDSKADDYLEKAKMMQGDTCEGSDDLFRP